MPVGNVSRPCGRLPVFQQTGSKCVSWQWVHSCSSASLGTVALCRKLRKCPHVLWFCAYLCTGICRWHTCTGGSCTPAEAGLEPAFPPLDLFSPCGEKEEPKGQRPSSQGRQLGLELQRGRVGTAPSLAQLGPQPSLASSWAAPPREPCGAACVGAGALFGVGAESWSRRWGPTRPKQQRCIGHQARSLQCDRVVAVDRGWKCTDDLEGGGVHSPEDRSEWIRPGPGARDPL